MKKILLGLICCFFLALPALSFGATGMYGSVNVGFAMAADSDISITGLPTVEIEYDPGFTIGGAVGYMNEKYRLEGELAYQANDVDKIAGVPTSALGISAEANILTFLFNGYYDFDTGTAFTPFITAGIGFANVSYEETGGADDDDTVFAYQIGAGIAYAMTDSMNLDLRYRYLGASDAEFSDPSGNAEVEVSSHNFTIGLRFAF